MNNPLMKSLWRGTRIALASALPLLLVACIDVPVKLAPPALHDKVPLAGLPTPAHGAWPAAQWWEQFKDPQLDNLMERALQQSPDLALAQSRVRHARESAHLAAAQLGLSVNGSAQVARQRLSSHGLIPSQFLGFSWYNQADLGVQLQYDFDWWGKKRATMTAALDQTRAAEARRSAAALAIEYAVADTYFGWQADQARLKIADQSLEVQQQLAAIDDLRVKQGVDLPDEAQRARARIAAVREMRVAIDGSAKIRRVTLASLLGIAPAQLPPLHARPLPAVDDGLPPGASLDLMARRPDIAASRWEVEAALRNTDAARAEFFPDLSISALAGLSSIDLAKLMTTGSRTFGLTPALNLPIFNSGSLRANYGVSKAQLDAAVAQYDSTVLAAAREVATQVLSAQQLVARRHEQQIQLDADRQLLSNAQARVAQGVRDARESLAAKAQLLQQRDAAAQLQAQALSVDLNLIKALGGGYQTSGHKQPSPSTSNSATAGAIDHERH